CKLKIGCPAVVRYGMPNGTEKCPSIQKNTRFLAGSQHFFCLSPNPLSNPPLKICGRLNSKQAPSDCEFDSPNGFATSFDSDGSENHKSKFIRLWRACPPSVWRNRKLESLIP
ncbi:MAG: hypothetical protein MUP16_00750, partial [Sedimentisphaerales bacterium]|nr:hypothetical protein [Sedimentisphaerales bacterium]